MKRPFMRRVLDRIGSAIRAAAFAEEGDVDTARRILAEDDDEDADEPPDPGTGRCRPPPRPARIQVLQG